MRCTIPASALAILLALPGPAALAERLSEKRETASHIITGKVVGVFKRDLGPENQYVVMIRIEAIEKGDGFKVKDIFYAYCFQRKPDAPKTPSAGGHSAVPKEGQRIKAFVHRRNGIFEGNYTDWFDVIDRNK